jgi:formylglycine-generating enzyme required for sulfatase activity
MKKACCTPTAEARMPSRAVAAGAGIVVADVGARGRAGAPADSIAAGLRAIPAGSFTMGNDGPDAVPGDGEGPTRRVTLEAYSIGAATVTNAEFAAFVRATRHVTDAERLGSSFVFYLQLPEAERAAATRVVAGLPWWLPVEHASWQRPEGPGSQVRERMAHPVVHVSWNDAMAYGAWAGTRLPSEAEWERAARGGLEGKRFAWGDELFDARGVPRCNVFRGAFPNAPTPGWAPGPVEARAGEPNGLGLYNVCGNVWEWCADVLEAERRPLRGGSFLCHDSYCNRYRVAARTTNTPETSASNIGFRVAR